MSLVDPAPPLLALLTTLIVAAHLAAFYGFVRLLARVFGWFDVPVDEDGNSWDEDMSTPFEPPRGPGGITLRPVQLHRRRPVGVRRDRDRERVPTTMR